MKIIEKISLFLCLALAFSSVSYAADWSQWGGNSTRNMASPDRGLPTRFEAGRFKPDSDVVDTGTTKNVRWVAKLGSQSYGNATVANGRVLWAPTTHPHG